MSETKRRRFARFGAGLLALSLATAACPPARAQEEEPAAEGESKGRPLDGYFGTAPVHAFQPNGYDLHNVSGNVWEWCQDYFSPRYHHLTASTDPINREPAPNRSMRGGSFLCHESYCNRYRVGARSSNTPDSASSNIGFRVVRVESAS